MTSIIGAVSRSPFLKDSIFDELSHQDNNMQCACMDGFNEKVFFYYYNPMGYIKTAQDDKSYVMIMGEIFQADFVDNKSDSDADVVLELYNKYAVDMFNRINGSFIAAIYDSSKNETVIVRDKMGTIPLYYHLNKDMFVFSNEIKKMLDLSVRRSVNERCIPEYLLFRYVAGEDTLFDGIRELLPGECVIFVDGKIHKHRYYECSFEIDYSLTDEGEVIQLQDKILYKCLVDRIQKNDDIGILLSGGLDSSYLAHKARQYYAGTIKSYTVGFEHKDYDEVRYAEWIKGRYGFQHKNYYINEEDYFDNYIDALLIHEEPINHPSTVSMNIISKFAHANGAKAFISGEGADSVLGSSPNIFLLHIARQGKPIKRFLETLLNIVPAALLPGIIREKQSKIIKTLRMNGDDFAIQGSAYGDIDWLKSISKKAFDLSFLSLRYGIYKHKQDKNSVNPYLRLTQETSLVSSLKMFSKITLANGIKLQIPFMDDRFVGFMNRLPSWYKFRGKTGKYAFKVLCEQYFPKSFIYRRKYGFGVPLEQWLMNKEYLGRYVDLLLDQRSLERGYFEKKQLKVLVDKYRDKQMSNSSYEGLLWTLLNLEMWIRVFIEELSI